MFISKFFNVLPELKGISTHLITIREGAKFIGKYGGQDDGGQGLFLRKKNDGARTLFCKKNDGAKTFFHKK